MSKVAIVHDWLVAYAGGERVLEQIIKCYPDADLFSVVDFLDDDVRQNHFMGKKATTTFIQRLPFAKKKYRAYLPIMPFAIEQLDLSRYDLIISSSHAVAKGVITGPDQLHISYVHSPMRYAWDLQHQYLKESGLQKGIKGFFAKYFLHKLRQWDYCSAARVDAFIANSNFISRRIQKVYRRDSTVIYPPVDVEGFPLYREKKNYYLTASRLVPYKRIDLVVEAFNRMPDKRLIVVGDGPEMHKIKKLAFHNVELMGYQNQSVMQKMMQEARAFVFAAEEDFGIVPVEAQACGTPVIAYGKGGALETVRSIDQEKPTGLLFAEQTEEAIVDAIEKFESTAVKINSENCRENALKFSEEIFREAFKKFVNSFF